jgi:hypothetical protein
MKLFIQFVRSAIHHSFYGQPKVESTLENNSMDVLIIRSVERQWKCRVIIRIVTMKLQLYR